MFDIQFVNRFDQTACLPACKNDREQDHHRSDQKHDRKHPKRCSRKALHILRHAKYGSVVQHRRIIIHLPVPCIRHSRDLALSGSKRLLYFLSAFVVFQKPLVAAGIIKHGSVRIDPRHPRVDLHIVQTFQIIRTDNVHGGPDITRFLLHLGFEQA